MRLAFTRCTVTMIRVTFNSRSCNVCYSLLLCARLHLISCSSSFVVVFLDVDDVVVVVGRVEKIAIFTWNPFLLPINRVKRITSRLLSNVISQLLLWTGMLQRTTSTKFISFFQIFFLLLLSFILPFSSIHPQCTLIFPWKVVSPFYTHFEDSSSRVIMLLGWR